MVEAGGSGGWKAFSWWQTGREVAIVLDLRSVTSYNCVFGSLLVTLANPVLSYIKRQILYLPLPNLLVPRKQSMKVICHECQKIWAFTWSLRQLSRVRIAGLVSNWVQGHRRGTKAPASGIDCVKDGKKSLLTRVLLLKCMKRQACEFWPNRREFFMVHIPARPWSY